MQLCLKFLGQCHISLAIVRQLGYICRDFRAEKRKKYHHVVANALTKKQVENENLKKNISNCYILNSLF